MYRYYIWLYPNNFYVNSMSNKEKGYLNVCKSIDLCYFTGKVNLAMTKPN